MADNEPQQALMVNGDLTVINNISNSQLSSDLQQKNDEVVSTSDILQRAFDEAGGFEQTLLNRPSDPSSVQENSQHLTDHSYIHTNSNADSSITSTDSQDINPDCNDSNKELNLPNIQFSSDVDLNVSHGLETSFTNETTKLNLSVDKLKIVENILAKQIITTSNTVTPLDPMSSNNLVIESEKVTPLPSILKKKVESFSSNAPSSSSDSVISLRLPLSENLSNSSLGSLRNELPIKISNSSLGSLCSNDSADSVFPSDSSIVQNPTDQSLQFVLKPDIQSTANTSSNNAIHVTKVLAKPTNAPLGSVGNPIQIIHNGTSYLSTQMLSQAQLQQITHVLQQQQAKKLANGGKSSILFEPNTRTRIVCRVVQPSELQQKLSKPETSKANNCLPAVGKGRGRPKAKDRSSQDDERNSSFSKEEREERKKHRPRTRSGRISKPPNHLAKDYKRIHPLDLNEEVYDDSDGGYSDYHVSDDEVKQKEAKASSLPPGVTTAKPRKYSCVVCDKAYIGRGGLSRHYRLNPGHGSLPEGEDASTQDENSNSSMASSILSNSGSNTNNQSIPVIPTPSSTKQGPSILQEALTQDSFPSEQQKPQAPVNEITPPIDRRKSKLKEILKGYSTSELVDVLLPKFAEEVSTWKFFTTKCHRETEGETLFEMLKEFEKFLTPMQRVSCSCLSRASEADRGKTIINITSQRLAEVLTLEKGSYTVNSTEMVVTNLKSIDFRLSNTVPLSSAESEVPNHPLHSFPKRKRLDPSVVDVNAGLPEQILSDAQESNCLDLPMSEESFSETADFHHQQTNLLNVCVAKGAIQNDLNHKNLFDLNSSTIVTPSSLSSGCLSAVNSSDLQKGIQLQNMQVRKIRLLNAALQNQTFSTAANAMALNGLALSSNSILGGLTSQTQVKDSVAVQHQEDLVSSSSAIENKAFRAIGLESAAGIFNSCPELSQANLIDTHQSSSNAEPNASFVNSFHINNSCLPADSHKVSVQSDVQENLANCLVVADIAHSLENPNTSISESDIQTCVSAGIIPASSHPVERQFQVTSTDIVSSDNVKSPEQAVLRQLMLPDGRIIGVWSSVDNADKASNEQILQGFLPGNLILVQNSDGSIQVPQNQGAALETLQALTSADSAASDEARSIAHTSVNM
ncbi:serine-rich adhesin for platelets isoform X1 [Parasteatoda tepidariorum]|uniref:serine-rich adhesin for platelets isoform X1 n=1 Tax=Parasteatoda tepidariorum TaxID=114398 RepID=UPI00077F93CD|nr:uncharacterized protein LOC107453009 [Parasteatoda tepidariorum]